jgi:hypothetical protein
MDVDGGFGRLPVTSGLLRTSDIIRSPRHVSKVPTTEVTNRYSISSSARAGMDGSELLSGIHIDGEFDLRRRLDRLPTRRSASVMLVCLQPHGRLNSQRL